MVVVQTQGMAAEDRAERLQKGIVTVGFTARLFVGGGVWGGRISDCGANPSCCTVLVGYPAALSQMSQ